MPRKHHTARNWCNSRLLASNGWQWRKKQWHYEAKEYIQKSLTTEEEAARQCQAMLEEAKQLKAKVKEVQSLGEQTNLQQSAQQLQLAQ